MRIAEKPQEKLKGIINEIKHIIKYIELIISTPTRFPPLLPQRGPSSSEQMIWIDIKDESLIGLQYPK